MSFRIGSIENRNTYSMPVSRDAKHVSIYIADGAQKANQTPVGAVMNTAGKAASKIIDSGVTIISAPATWIKSIQENWLSYMILAAIIIGLIAFLYCACLCHCNPMTSSATQSQLIELTRTIGSKIIPTPQPPPLSTISPSNLPYLAQNSQV